MAFPVVAFLKMLTKSVNLRATAATRTGCVRHGMGHQTPFSGRGSRNAASSTNSCPTYGRFQHLRVTVSPNLSGRNSLLLPLDARSQEYTRDWTPSSRSLYSMPGRFSNLGSATSSIPACTNSKFQRSGEEH